jgi:UPF0716 protein FxsA
MTTSPFAPRRFRRRGRWGWLLLAAVVLLPFVEIYLIIQVGQAIGAGWTLLLLIAGCVLGAWLIAHEGRRAWRILSTTMASGQMPGRELADKALILVGGVLLLIPGFVTDVLALFLILPFTRPLARRGLGRVVSRRFLDGQSPGPGPQGPVVRGEVVDE